MKTFAKIIRFGTYTVLVGLLIGGLATTGVYLYLAPKLPSTEILKDVRFQVPLRIYTQEGLLIAEYGEKKRTPVSYEDTPEPMIKAVLAAEDDRFFEHPGVDYQGILRASYNLLTTGEKSQGGSTITMQLARNFFLSSEKTYLRKLNEILLALKIEQNLTKAEILELYLNKIYLGNRAYGIGAAAQVYYGKPLNQLTVAQLAMIAGLPKAPSRYNPIADPQRALLRRNYVLSRMRALGYVSDEVYQFARAEPVTARLHTLGRQVEASYVAEMVRHEVVNQYGEDAYSSGLRVYTTVNGGLQEAGNRALRKALQDYDKRHGYRGAVQHVARFNEMAQDQWPQMLEKVPKVASLYPALVIGVEEQAAQIYLGDGTVAEIPWEGLSWARPYIDENRRGAAPKAAADVVQAGDIVMVERGEEGIWNLSQIPQVEGALISLAPETGAINTLVGGFDYFKSKFNRVVQAERQPGSSFKPFIYSAALEKGYTPASLINDAPVVFEDPGLESAWRPENYSGKFYGPTRLREALVRSRNLVSIRLLRSIGIDYALKHASNFGFPVNRLPRNLSLALGSGAVTPIQLARAHSVFANGGYLIEPYVIEHITDAEGNVVYETVPYRVCPECKDEQADQPGASDLQVLHEVAALEGNTDKITAASDHYGKEGRKFRPAERVIPAQNAYLVNSMMRDVIRRGTGVRAKQLGRQDVAGKTGTTNDQKDAWFVGFNRDIATITWVGFDNPRPLGNGETGSRAALPMWIEYMRTALVDTPEATLDQPDGLVTVRIDPDTGLLASADDPDAVFEVFRSDEAPTRYAGPGSLPSSATNKPGTGAGVPEQLF